MWLQRSFNSSFNFINYPSRWEAILRSTSKSNINFMMFDAVSSKEGLFFVAIFMFSVYVYDVYHWYTKNDNGYTLTFTF